MSLNSNTQDLNQILNTMNNLPLGGGGLKQIGEMIDESGVLDSTKGTVEEKIEQLIEIIEENTLPDWDDDSPIIASGYGYPGQTRCIWEITEKGTMKWRLNPDGDGYGFYTTCAGWDNSIGTGSAPKEFLEVCGRVKQLLVPEGFQSVYLGYLPNCKRMQIPKLLNGLGLQWTGLKEIEDYTQSDSDGFGCSNNYVLDRIILSNTRTTIKSYFAQGCVSLKEVINIENITSFGDYCFSDCVSFSPEIVFNGSLTLLGRNSFYRTSVKTVTFRNTDVLPTINTNSFLQCKYLTDIYCPWAEGEVANAPWGATNATIHFNTQYDENGNPIIEEV